MNISDKDGKTYYLEIENEELLGKELHEHVQGKDILPDLDGYEFEISGASDKSGFTAHEKVVGTGLKRIILSYEKSMKKRPRKEGKKKRSDYTPKGLRLRKTVRGRAISSEIKQINIKIIKPGTKKLSEIFPEQNKEKEEPKKTDSSDGTNPKSQTAQKKEN